jgi:hypothetical protein
MLLGVSTAIIPSVDKAPLTFSGVVVRDPFTTQKDLTRRVAKVYQSQVIRQRKLPRFNVDSSVYKVFGSLNIIGSPVSMITTLGSGIFDLYDKPIVGLQKTAFGVVNAASNITYATATAAKKLIGDKEFVSEIEQKALQKEPENIPEGVVLGVDQMGKGLEKGASSLVSIPEESSTKGIAGFLTGLSKSLIRTITRPTIGALEVPLETAQGVSYKNTKLNR